MSTRSITRRAAGSTQPDRTPADAAALLDAYLSGDPAAFSRALEDAVNAAYLGDYAGFTLEDLQSLTTRSR